jgi:hypothetical protein
METKMPYTEFKELLGVAKIKFFPPKEGKERVFGMLGDKCVIVAKKGLTIQDLVENEKDLYVVKNPEKGYFLTISQAVEI